MYLPFKSASPTSAAIIVRSQSDLAAIVPVLRDIVRRVDPDVPLYRVRTMRKALEDAEWNTRLVSALIDTIAIVAMILAAIGLYAVSAHGVVQRRHDIGVRMALGVRPTDVIALVLQRGSVQLGFGAAAGVGATWMFQRVVGLGTDAFGYRMMDAAPLFVVGCLLAVVTLLACALLARRASRIDPACSLRAE